MRFIVCSILFEGRFSKRFSFKNRLEFVICVCNLYDLFVLKAYYLLVGTIPIAQQRMNRVHIQVFRGPNNEDEQYARWGYIVRQPTDTNYHYR